MKIGRSINNCRVHVRETTGKVQLIWAKHVLTEPKAMQSMQECRMHILLLSNSYEISYVGKGQPPCRQGM